MKLYATTTSERASKGQGGNEYLKINIFYGNTSDSKELAKLEVKPVAEGYGLYLNGGMILHSSQVERKLEKGKSQKGEKICEYCNINKATMFNDIDGHYCKICWGNKAI